MLLATTARAIFHVVGGTLRRHQLVHLRLCPRFRRAGSIGRAGAKDGYLVKMAKRAAQPPAQRSCVITSKGDAVPKAAAAKATTVEEHRGVQPQTQGPTQPPAYAKLDEDTPTYWWYIPRQNWCEQRLVREYGRVGCGDRQDSPNVPSPGAAPAVDSRPGHAAVQL